MIITVQGDWNTIFQKKIEETLERDILPSYIKGCRWFGAKTREIVMAEIVEDIAIGESLSASHLLLLEIHYTEDAPDLYLLPLSFASGDDAVKIAQDNPQAIIAQVKGDDGEGIIFDAVYDKSFQENIFSLISLNQKISGTKGKLIAYQGKIFNVHKKKFSPHESRVLKADQSNTSFFYGQDFFFKLYRHLNKGINPELEIERFLTEKQSFPHIPALEGAIEYIEEGHESIVMGILEQFVPNKGDAWSFTLDEIGKYFDLNISIKYFSEKDFLASKLFSLSLFLRYSAFTSPLSIL